MKKKDLKLNGLMIKSFVTSLNDADTNTVKAGRAPFDDTSDSVVTCDTNNNCTKYYPCEAKDKF